MTTPRPVATVLAGGRSRRLGPGSKALARLGGHSLLHRVVERLRPQAEAIWISVQDTEPELAIDGCEAVPDLVSRFRGPLVGLYSALERLSRTGADWLLLAPCDAPFIPPDLAVRLQDAAGPDRSVAAARYEGVVQPVFSLWRRDLLGVVRDAVLDRGQGGLMALLDELPHGLADWPAADPSPFFNVNTPGDLERARRALDDAPSEGRH